MPNRIQNQIGSSAILAVLLAGVGTVLSLFALSSSTVQLKKESISHRANLIGKQWNQTISDRAQHFFDTGILYPSSKNIVETKNTPSTEPIAELYRLVWGREPKESEAQEKLALLLLGKMGLSEIETLIQSEARNEIGDAASEKGMNIRAVFRTIVGRQLTNEEMALALQLVSQTSLSKYSDFIAAKYSVNREKTENLHPEVLTETLLRFQGRSLDSIAYTSYLVKYYLGTLARGNITVEKLQKDLSEPHNNILFNYIFKIKSRGEECGESVNALVRAKRVTPASTEELIGKTGWLKKSGGEWVTVGQTSPSSPKCDLAWVATQIRAGGVLGDGYVFKPATASHGPVLAGTIPDPRAPNRNIVVNLEFLKMSSSQKGTYVDARAIATVPVSPLKTLSVLTNARFKSSSDQQPSISLMGRPSSSEAFATGKMGIPRGKPGAELGWETINMKDCAISPGGPVPLQNKTGQSIDSPPWMPMTDNQVYTLSCNTLSNEVYFSTFTVKSAWAEIYADGDRGVVTVSPGETPTISWKTSNVVSGTCVVNSTLRASEGNYVSAPINSNTSFTITCDAADERGGKFQVTDTVEVQVSSSQVAMNPPGWDRFISYWWAGGLDLQNPSAATHIDTALPAYYSTALATNKANIVVGGYGVGHTWGHWQQFVRVANIPDSLTTSDPPVIVDGGKAWPVLDSSSASVCPPGHVMTGQFMPAPWRNIALDFSVVKGVGDVTIPYGEPTYYMICRKLSPQFKTGKEVWKNIFWYFDEVSTCPKNYVVTSQMIGPGYNANNKYRCTEILRIP